MVSWSGDANMQGCRFRPVVICPRSGHLCAGDLYQNGLLGSQASDKAGTKPDEAERPRQAQGEEDRAREHSLLKPPKPSATSEFSQMS